jgi:hypothetical protein
MIVKPDGVEETVVLVSVILEQFLNDFLGLCGCRKVDEARSNERG